MQSITVTAKIQISVSAVDKPMLDSTLTAYCNACNYVSGYVFETYDLKQFSLNKVLYAALRERFGLKFAYFSQGMEKYFEHDTYKFGTAKLVNKHGKYFLHIPVTYEVGECLDADVCNVAGIDRGINFVVAAYDSRHKSGFVSGKTIKQKRAHYKYLRKELQQVRTPSSRRRMKAIGQRENRWIHQDKVIRVNPAYTS